MKVFFFSEQTSFFTGTTLIANCRKSVSFSPAEVCRVLLCATVGDSVETRKRGNSLLQQSDYTFRWN